MRTIAAVASLGAGALHASAAGSHGEHRPAALAFALVALAQLGWGAAALSPAGHLLDRVGAAVNAAALGGWVLAKTVGIGFVAGLDTPERVGLADALAAALALVAMAGALSTRTARPMVVGVAAVATAALTVPVMAAGHGHVHHTATLPVDLSGMPGVTARQVAEALVTATIRKLPRFADVRTVGALGYRTIGDADTGFEHFVNWPLVDDGRVLDPDHPESLVYTVDRSTGRRTLSAAMFMAGTGTTLGTVPDLGGALR